MITSMGISVRSGRRAGFRSRAGAIGLGRSTLISAGIAVTAAGALTAIALASGGSALAAGRPGPGARPAAPDATAKVTRPADGYQFVEIGNQDRGYNLIFGINDQGRVAGYSGSGDKGDASLGYTISAPYAQVNLKNEDFPGSAQTEVMGLNDHNVQVGYFSTQKKAYAEDDNSLGWYFNGSFHKVVAPADSKAHPTTELRAVNNHDVAAGFYRNSGGLYRGFTFNIKTGKFARVTEPGAAAYNLQASGINNAGDVVGEHVSADGTIAAFFKRASGAFFSLAIPGAQETFALGVNDHDTVVGDYLDLSGAVHGFIWQVGHSVITPVDDPNAVGLSTEGGLSVLAGINNEGDIAGYYMGSSGVDGFIAYPAF